MTDFAYTGPRRKLTKIPLRLLLVIILLVVIVRFAIAVVGSRGIVSPIPKDGILIPLVNKLPVLAKKRDPEALKQAVISIVGDFSDNYSVLVKDYNSNLIVAIDDTIIYEAASVNKVPILAALYHKIQNGEVNPDRVITMQQADIQKYGTGSMRYDPPGTTYSIKTMARLMIKQSDNTAAYIIANHIVGLKTIQNLIEGWGLTQTDMIKNNTSNKDMAILFEKLLNGRIVNPALTDELRSLLSDSDFENRLPALLPEEATVYHKIGTEVGVLHDVGVVATSQKTYYIGVMIGDVTDEKKAEEMIANISKAVYDFMQ